MRRWKPSGGLSRLTVAWNGIHSRCSTRVHTGHAVGDQSAWDSRRAGPVAELGGLRGVKHSRELWSRCCDASNERHPRRRNHALTQDRSAGRAFSVVADSQLPATDGGSGVGNGLSRGRNSPFWRYLVSTSIAASTCGWSFGIKMTCFSGIFVSPATFSWLPASQSLAG